MKTKNRSIRKIKIGFLLVSTATLLIGFQNCAQPGAAELTNTSAVNDDQVVQASSVAALSDDGAGASSPDFPSDTVFRDPYTPSSLLAYSCTHVTTLIPPTDGSALVIPPRSTTGSGECYAVKLMDPASFPVSSNNPVIDHDLITRNHDLTSYTAADVHAPYLLGRSRLQLYLQGERSVLMAGGADPTANIYVDNFLLVGLAPTAQYGNPYYYLAYGTSDATALFNGTTNSVLFNQQPVLLKPYAVGGTAPIPPISLDNKISSQVYYTLDARAIDCGGVGYLSTIYVLFQ